MQHGFGPHSVITTGEVTGTLITLTLAVVAFVWMAYKTRNV